MKIKDLYSGKDMPIDFVIGKLNGFHRTFKNTKSIKYYFIIDGKAKVKINDNNLADTFEALKLDDSSVRTIFEHDLNGEKNSENFLLILPAGKSAHIEAGIAYWLGKKCYAIGSYDVTDSLYLIFDKIFENEDELREFLINQK